MSTRKVRWVAKGKHQVGKQERRARVSTAGTVVVSVGATVPLAFLSQARMALTHGAEPPPHRDALDSYVAIFADGGVLAYFRRLEPSTDGSKALVAQIVAEQLGISSNLVSVYGGTRGVSDPQLGHQQLRFAAAAVRRYLLWLAAKRLAVPADQLEVSDGVVSVSADTVRTVIFTDLIGSQFINNCSTDYSTE